MEEKRVKTCINECNGITLIALVITIIVLLVLAGISISMLTGENSILKNAQFSKTETEKVALEEKIKIAAMGAYNSNGNFVTKTFIEELERLGLTCSDAGSDLLIELPNGKQIMVSKTTGEVREGVHKIAYNYNGGEDTGEVPSDDTEYKEGENITIKFTPITEREGFEFLGWSTNANTADPEYKADGTTTIEMEKRSITLYAVWRGKPYTVSYDANNGTGNVPIDGGAHIKGENVAVSFTPQPTRAGYTFVGWSEDKNSLSAEYTSDGIKTIKMPAKEVKLYAIWMANSNTTYTVEHYQMNTSGTYESTPTRSNKYTNGTTGGSITIADLKENYTGFTYKKGQVDGVDVTTTTVLGDGSRVIKVYYERNKYTLTFNGNGGSTPTAITAYYGATISMPTSTKNGYEYTGWYTATSGGTKVNYSTMPAGNATIYAGWRELVIGDEVTVGGEHFFVIENATASNSNVKLLSKLNLNQSGTAQQHASYGSTACAFSSSKYWSGNNENLNTNSAPSGSAYQKAKAYGTSKGGTGRLLTYQEAIALETSCPLALNGDYPGDSIAGTLFWLGTSHSNEGVDGQVWSRNGEIERFGWSVATDREWNRSSTCVGN